MANKIQESDVRIRVNELLSEKLQRLNDIQVKDLEIGIFNWVLDYAEKARIPRNWTNGKFKTLYIDKARSVLTNLDPNSYVGNMRLIDRLVEGEFKPHEIPFMVAENVFPERWKDLIDAKMKRDEYIFQEKPAAMTNQFRCGKCRKNECIYQELQLRSCDEPVTLFITCLNCGNRWRMG